MTYTDAVAEAHRILAAGRLDDPDEHFPYRHERARTLLEENPPAGPNGPDDDRLRARDFLSDAIADCTAIYVDSQAAFLADPSTENREAFKSAAEDLVAARQRHRKGRDGFALIGFRGAE